MCNKYAAYNTRGLPRVRPASTDKTGQNTTFALYIGEKMARSSRSKYYPLTKNPDPSDDRKAYLRHNVRTASPKYYSKEPLESWAFNKEDKAIVRHRIKEYKKGMNKKPKNWYVNKRKWNKKISSLSLAAYQNVSPAESASKVP